MNEVAAEEAFANLTNNLREGPLNESHVNDLIDCIGDLIQRVRNLEDILHSQADENDVAAKEAEAEGEMNG